MQNAETEIPQKFSIIQDYTLNISCYILYILMRIYNLDQNKNSNFYWNFKLHVKLFCYLSFIWPFWGICPNLFKKTLHQDYESFKLLNSIFAQK